jgi:signal transduction histidine kinase/integral membrane sensor domain MASE1
MIAEALGLRMRRMTIPAVALATCAGYYLGSLIGLALTLPPATTSVLWPPNAVLTSVLVLMRPRRWPLVLLPVLPLHVLIQYGTGWPLSLILSLFFTNCLEAMIAAGGMRLLSETPWRLDSLRGLTIFYVSAVIAAPLLSSFADAAAVHWFRGEPYWQVWGNRSISNVLAELVVVPAVVGGAWAFARWWRRGRPMPRLEAVVLVLGLIGIASARFSGVLDSIPSLSAVSNQMPLAVQLPFLLWAAMRFGPAGTGIAVLFTSITSAWAVVNGIGPFAEISASTTVRALTVSMIVVATTLLCLATLIEERRQTQHALKLRLEFESLLSRLSSALVQQPSDQMPRAFETWLGRLVRVLGIDALTIFVTSGESRALAAMYSWVDGPVRSNAADLATQHLAWAERTLALQDAVLVWGSDTLSGSRQLRVSSQSLEVKAGGAIPLVGEGQPLGAFAFSSVCEQPRGPMLSANLWLVGEVLAGALRRKHSEDALVKTELMKSAILQSLTSGVAVIDRAGYVLQLNAQWLSARGCQWMGAAVGDNLIYACRRASETGDHFARQMADGLANVLDRSRDQFALELMIGSGADAAWWSLAGVPLNRPEGGAVVTCADITELRRAEMEAHRSRQELAHVGRVSTVGEMTASLAHQLNQPLAAIMTNAQAAGRMLSTPQPDINEVRAILRDIVRDDRRASEVIQRLRQLLRKGELEIASINLTAAIREVVELVSTEAALRNIALAFDFDQDPVCASGDRVQLQQVILNLLHNAMEAMAEQQKAPRGIVIGCHRFHHAIVVTVRDSGPGLTAGTEHLVFEPFYTTKQGGMGMGLSIVRSIIEAHGGMIHATNVPGGGALIEFQLPAAETMPA